MKAAALSIIGIFFMFFSGYSQDSDSSVNKTTLDSLQGVWRLQSNGSEELKFMHDTLLYVSNNNFVDGGILYINNAFLDSAGINPKDRSEDEYNGRYVTVQTSVIKYYEIKSISTNELILFTDGETLVYNKE
jgi:hypothetical protein